MAKQTSTENGFKDLKEEILKHTEDATKTTETRDTEPAEESRPKATKKKRSKTKELEEKIELLEKELDSWKDKALRLGAEVQNVRRRYDKELANTVVYANQKLIESIIPIVDELELALRSSQTSKNLDSFKSGVEMIYNKLLQVLEKEGVKPIQAEGQKFDYNLHEAIMMKEAKDVESGTILEVVQKGYLYKDKVLRHAKVIVAK